jgi:uncharacterized lipoprotein YajG
MKTFFTLLALAVLCGCQKPNAALEARVTALEAQQSSNVSNLTELYRLGTTQANASIQIVHEIKELKSGSK